jgi:ApbE superfamily uncharacterized protein (UPF0280 family)
VNTGDLVAFTVSYKETDLYIRAATDLRLPALQAVRRYRKHLEDYVSHNPEFATALAPVAVSNDAPEIVNVMAEAALKAGVGPMAAVAGAIAEFTGKALATATPEIIIENGGDIYLRSLRKRIIGIYAGDSPLNGKIGLEFEGMETPRGICTSSGTVGHSLSYGKANAAIVLADSTALADAAATALGNIIRRPADIERGIAVAREIPGLKGILIIIGEKMGMWGGVKLCKT